MEVVISPWLLRRFVVAWSPIVIVSIWPVRQSTDLYGLLLM